MQGLVGEIHGVPRAVLLTYAMSLVPLAQRRLVATVEIASGEPLVNMGMNFQTVAWRAVMRDPRMPSPVGIIPVWRGEIAEH